MAASTQLSRSMSGAAEPRSAGDGLGGTLGGHHIARLDGDHVPVPGSYEPVPAPTLTTVRLSPKADRTRSRSRGSSRRFLA